MPPCAKRHRLSRAENAQRNPESVHRNDECCGVIGAPPQSQHGGPTPRQTSHANFMRAITPRHAISRDSVPTHSHTWICVLRRRAGGMCPPRVVDVGRTRPDFGRPRAQVGSTLVDQVPIWAELSRPRAKAGQVRTKLGLLADVGPNLVNIVPKLVEVGPSLVESAPSLLVFWPISGQLWSRLVEVGLRLKSLQFRGETRPGRDSGQKLAEVAPNSATFGRFGQIRSTRGPAGRCQRNPLGGAGNRGPASPRRPSSCRSSRAQRPGGKARGRAHVFFARRSRQLNMATAQAQSLRDAPKTGSPSISRSKCMSR